MLQPNQRRGWAISGAVSVVVAVIGTIGIWSTLARRHEGHHDFRLAKARTVLATAKQFQAERGTWPLLLSDLADASYLEKESVARMIEQGYVLSVSASGECIVQWNDGRGARRELRGLDEEPHPVP